MKPRRYQERAIEQFVDWIKRPDQNLATIILPMGTGKTRCATWALETHYKNIQNYKTLWVAHREELIEQAAKELRTIPDVNVEIEMASNRASPNADIMVGTVQTLYRYRKNIHGFKPDLIIIDEWHHYDEKNKTYHGLWERFPDAKVLGLTATPFRFSGGDLPLGRKLIEMDIGLAVRKGYLVKPKPQTIKTDISLANVKTRAGDFAIDDLSKTINVDKRNKLIVDKVIDLVKNEKRQGFLYGADVAHSKAMYQLLKNKVRAAEIYGETDKEERREIIKKLNNGDIDVIVNNLVLTEGVNIPHISFVCIARPTRSLGLYCQCAGRALRLHENKKDAIIVDVFDKIKVTQSRISFSDMASAGDMDGAVARTEAILKEPIAEKLNHFPSVLALSKGQRWTINDTKWFAPSWQLAQNQWIIVWNKTAELVESKTEFEYTNFRFAPKNLPINVRHAEYGDGLALSVDSSPESKNSLYSPFDKMIKTKFNNVERIVPLSSLLKQEPKLEKKKLDKPIKRIIYVCTSVDEKRGRLISVKQDNSFEVTHDIKGDQTTLDEMVKTIAAEDDVSNLVKSNARWRQKPASDKQKGLIKKFVQWNKISDDIDIDTMTGGDASGIIDQVNWHDTINQLFATKEIEKLIGFNALYADV